MCGSHKLSLFALLLWQLLSLLLWLLCGWGWHAAWTSPNASAPPAPLLASLGCHKTSFPFPSPPSLSFYCEFSDWTVCLFFTTSQYGYCYCHWRIAWLQFGHLAKRQLQLQLQLQLATCAQLWPEPQQHNSTTCCQAVNNSLGVAQVVVVAVLQPAHNLWHVAWRQQQQQLQFRLVNLAKCSAKDSWKNLQCTPGCMDSQTDGRTDRLIGHRLCINHNLCNHLQRSRNGMLHAAAAAAAAVINCQRWPRA